MINAKQIAEAVLNDLMPWQFVRHGLEDLADGERAEFEDDLQRAITEGIAEAASRTEDTPIPTFGWHGNTEAPWWGHSHVCDVDEEGNEIDTLAFVPRRGKQGPPTDAACADAENESIALAQFIVAGLNAYVTTQQGKAEWDQIDRLRDKALAHYRK